MNIRKIIILAIIALLAVAGTLRLITYKKPLDRIKNNLISLGFTPEEDNIIYYKQLSDLSESEYNINKNQNIDSTFDILYFNTSIFELTETKLEYSSEVSTSFIPVYNYQNNSLKYNYRITYNSTTVIYEGEYDLDDKTLTCNNIYAHDINLPTNENNICEEVKTNIDNFTLEIDKLITSQKLLNYMKKSDSQ
jgi:uridine kinase